MSTEAKEIIERLDAIKSELDFIKENMVDRDSILTEDDRKALEEAEKEFKQGKTTSISNLKKELGI